MLMPGAWAVWQHYNKALEQIQINSFCFSVAFLRPDDIFSGIILLTLLARKNKNGSFPVGQAEKESYMLWPT